MINNLSGLCISKDEVESAILQVKKKKTPGLNEISCVIIAAFEEFSTEKLTQLFIDIYDTGHIPADFAIPHSPKLYVKIKELQQKKQRIKLGLRNKEGVVLQEDDDIKKRWHEYVKQLYSDRREEEYILKSKEEVEVNITEEEVEETIKMLPRRKATGVDEIPAEFLQSCGPHGIKVITAIINKIYRTGELPIDFLTNVFIPIPKIAKAMKCEDHRTISLISHASKILLYIIKKRITPFIERNLTESQFGFRKDRGTRNAIHLLRILGERMIGKKKDLFVCYIDYSKAFDKCKEFLRRDLALTLKKRLLDCYVKSVEAYGCEAWTFSKEIIARINALQLWCYRRMLKVKYTDHVTNKKVKERIGAEKIQWAEDLARRKLKFAGHVMRGCCDTLTQLVLEGLVEGKRDRGRQRRVWGDDLKEWTRSKNLGEVKRKAENKVEWRIMVHDLRFEDVT
ncbi:LINE-1 reverse transcriptase [Nymphon striatum]|nr:LINE-1 reverse transcriptase [Nymphon striatum]